MEFAADYGLFLAKVFTLVVAFVAVVSAVMIAARKGTSGEHLTVEHLNKRFERLGDVLRGKIDGKALKKQLKARKKANKAASKDESRQRTFVLDFKGDIRASATASLRQEITAILNVAQEGDEVLVRLENPGGTVHEHGLAASQLVRLRERGLRLTVAVDKVAASGGYLMACVADHIIAAPFAIVDQSACSRRFRTFIVSSRKEVWISSKSRLAGSSAPSPCLARIPRRVGIR